MINLSISGFLEKDMVIFSLNGESKSVDQFCKQIHFSLEEKKTYRLYFEQKSEQLIPRFAEFLLNILFLPIRGVFNVLAFYANQTWEKDISAFKISGYIDINLDHDTKISFELKQGRFEKQTNTFYKPTISFSHDVSMKKTYSKDIKEITKNHHNYVQNICSSSALLLALLLYLLFVGFKNELYDACIVTSTLIIFFSILTLSLIFHSYRKRTNLISTLTSQQSK